MTVKGQVDYWLKLSHESLLDMRSALRNGRRVNALFCGHLALEKIFKALCAARYVPSSDIWGHNLIKLAKDANYRLDHTQSAELNSITSFNIAARYDDRKQSFAGVCTPLYAKHWAAVIESWYVLLKGIILLERSALPNNKTAT
jgi:HEPN domain-containing protein